ncbi:hypothetical protein SKa4_00041 [Pseudomonas phage vB_PpuM-SKa-4]
MTETWDQRRRRIMAEINAEESAKEQDRQKVTVKHTKWLPPAGMVRGNLANHTLAPQPLNPQANVHKLIHVLTHAKEDIKRSDRLVTLFLPGDNKTRMLDRDAALNCLRSNEEGFPFVRGLVSSSPEFEIDFAALRLDEASHQAAYDKGVITPVYHLSLREKASVSAYSIYSDEDVITPSVEIIYCMARCVSAMFRKIVEPILTVDMKTLMLAINAFTDEFNRLITHRYMQGWSARYELRGYEIVIRLVHEKAFKSYTLNLAFERSGVLLHLVTPNDILTVNTYRLLLALLYPEVKMPAILRRDQTTAGVMPYYFNILPSAGFELDL